MIDLKLSIGERWDIEGQEYVLDQLLGDGLLNFRSVRTAGPYQIALDDGSSASPSMSWLKLQLASGAVRRVDRDDTNVARNISSRQEYDAERIHGKDARARVRQIVLSGLDRLPSYSRSDRGLNHVLASIWAAKHVQLSDHKPPAPSTVREWLKTRGGAGDRKLKAMVSMSGRVPRRKRLAPSVRRRLHAYAIKYWSDPRVSIGDIYNLLWCRFARINAWLARHGNGAIAVPSKEAFRRHVRSIECLETVTAKFGAKEANRRFKACGEGLRAHRPLLLGAMDHTILDCHVVVDHHGFKLLGRPTLTVLIDVHSRCIVGWLISFEPPSLFSVMECIKRANRPKLNLLDRYSDHPELADIFGRFDEIVVDNGWEFAGVSFEASMAEVGITVRWAPVASPTYKAVIERFFHTLNTMLNHKLPGGTYPPDKLRAWGLDPRHDAVLTLSQVESMLWSTISTYHLERHRTLGDSPARVWTNGIRQHGIPVIGDERQLDKMLGAHETRTLARSGISLFNLQYHDPSIVGPLLEKLAAKQPVRARRKGSATAKVTVKYNPADIGEINVWDPLARQYVTLPCFDAEDVSGVSLWLHRRRAEWRAEDGGHCGQGEVERRVALSQEVENAVSDLVKNRRRKTAARLLSSEKVAQLSGGRLRIETALPRHDGMAPVVSQRALAPDRSDDLQRPVRPPRSGRRKKHSGAHSQVIAPQPRTGSYPNFEHDDADWGEFE